MIYPQSGRQWINPSKRLVDRAIEKWNGQGLRADNTSVVTVMLDPPGPPRAQVLKRQRELAQLNQGRSGIFNSETATVKLVVEKLIGRFKLGNLLNALNYASAQ